LDDNKMTHGAARAIACRFEPPRTNGNVATTRTQQYATYADSKQ